MIMAKGGGLKLIWFLLHALIGIYLINYQLKFVDLAFFASIDGWIVLIGGILVIISGLMHLLKKGVTA